MLPHRCFHLLMAYRSANPQVLGRDLAAVLLHLVADLRAFVQRAEASSFGRRDVYKNVFAAAVGLNEAISIGRVEPFYSTDRHVTSLLGVG